MTGTTGRWCRVAVASTVLLLAWLRPVEGQGPVQGQTSPEWASPDGREVFVNSGCGKCHSLRRVGGGSAPDLAALPPVTGFFELAAAVWNHVPRMGAAMWETGIERLLSGRQTSTLLAFIFTAQYLDVSGDADTGERLFRDRGCARCHAAGEEGPPGMLALDVVKKSDSGCPSPPPCGTTDSPLPSGCARRASGGRAFASVRAGGV
jgi:mono/diheme cytochrome c family protein